MKDVKPIPLNINKPGTPMKVLLCLLSGQIVSMCEGWCVKVPKDLKSFVNKHNPDAGYDWGQELLKRSDEMSTELLQQWLEAMPGGFARAELRGILMKRKSSETGQIFIEPSTEKIKE